MTREEYDSCRISQADPRVVAGCDKPHTQLQFTITFRYSTVQYSTVCDKPHTQLQFTITFR